MSLLTHNQRSCLSNKLNTSFYRLRMPRIVRKLNGLTPSLLQLLHGQLGQYKGLRDLHSGPVIHHPPVFSIPLQLGNLILSHLSQTLHPWYFYGVFLTLLMTSTALSLTESSSVSNILQSMTLMCKKCIVRYHWLHYILSFHWVTVD